MRKLALTSLFLISVSFLFSETIADSVYSDPTLDGFIAFEPNSQALSVNTWMYDMNVGDFCNQWVEPNTNLRSYISFQLPDIPTDYYVDSVYVRLYQYESSGQDTYNQFPVWDVEGGDTIKCVLSHINYGNELDESDWEKGNHGNINTYNNNAGIVSNSPLVGYRYINVTECVRNDYLASRSKSQYRIAFQLETDYDFLSDFLSFVTSSGHDYPELMPTLYITFSDEISSNEDNVIVQTVSINNYPNPFNPQTTISYSIAEPGNVQLQIFNIKGQLIQTLVDEFMDVGNHSAEWNAKEQASGIYFYQVRTNDSVIQKKCILLK